MTRVVLVALDRRLGMALQDSLVARAFEDGSEAECFALGALPCLGRLGAP